ncbi:hypothetical protein FH972_026074 [Carpinus fangiana]|uniref:Uncharacterized protein n=1 Tax=Carpinus fangiana TaxID=176857 RepID=A0A5N6L2Y6_9ROSI|nr:hypothetical protein FH972_026074 [Carpinus fangiana]
MALEFLRGMGRFVGHAKSLRSFNGDLNPAGRDVVAAAGLVAVLATAREAGATFGHRSSRLADGGALAAVAVGVVLLGAEGAMSSDGAGTFAIPRHHSAQAMGRAARGLAKAATETHVTHAVQQAVGHCGSCWRDIGARGARAARAVLLEAGDVSSQAGREAGCRLGRGRRVGAEVSKRLGGAEVGADGEASLGVWEAEETGRLVSNAAVESGILGTDVAEVSRGRAVQLSPLRVERVRVLRQWRTHAVGVAVDVDLARVAGAVRGVAQAQLMSQAVDELAVCGRDLGGEGEHFTGVGVALEQEQLRVVAESDGRGHGGLGVELGRANWAVLLLELAATLALLPLDAVSLGLGEHLFVLDTQLAAVEVQVIHGLDDGGRLLRRGEVGKGQAAEDAVVKVIVEGIGQGQGHVGHDGDQLLLLDGKGDVLDDDCGGDEVLVGVGADMVVAHLAGVVDGRGVAEAVEGVGLDGLGLLEPHGGQAGAGGALALLAARGGTEGGEGVAVAVGVGVPGRGHGHVVLAAAAAAAAAATVGTSHGLVHLVAVAGRVEARLDVVHGVGLVEVAVVGAHGVAVQGVGLVRVRGAGRAGGGGGVVVQVVLVEVVHNPTATAALGRRKAVGRSCRAGRGGGRSGLRGERRSRRVSLCAAAENKKRTAGTRGGGRCSREVVCDAECAEGRRCRGFLSSPVVVVSSERGAGGSSKRRRERSQLAKMGRRGGGGKEREREQKRHYLIGRRGMNGRRGESEEGKKQTHGRLSSQTGGSKERRRGRARAPSLKRFRFPTKLAKSTNVQRPRCDWTRALQQGAAAGPAFRRINRQPCPLLLDKGLRHRLRGPLTDHYSASGCSPLEVRKLFTRAQCPAPVPRQATTQMKVPRLAHLSCMQASPPRPRAVSCLWQQLRTCDHDVSSLFFASAVMRREIFITLDKPAGGSTVPGPGRRSDVGWR